MSCFWVIGLCELWKSRHSIVHVLKICGSNRPQWYSVFRGETSLGRQGRLYYKAEFLSTLRMWNMTWSPATSIKFPPIHLFQGKQFESKPIIENNINQIIDACQILNAHWSLKTISIKSLLLVKHSMLIENNINKIINACQIQFWKFRVSGVASNHLMF